MYVIRNATPFVIVKSEMIISIFSIFKLFLKIYYYMLFINIYVSLIIHIYL